MAQENYKKPFYGVKLSLSQVGVDIRVNDIPIYFDAEKGQLDVELPCPDSIINGKNELKVIAFPPKSTDAFLPNATMTASLFVQEVDDPNNKQEVLTSISIQVNPTGSVSVLPTSGEAGSDQAQLVESSKHKAVVTRNVNIKSPFPRWVWQDGPDIENTEENFRSLMNAYRYIHTQLNNKNKDEIFKIYQPRAAETAKAYHLSSIEEGHNKISTAKNMFDNSLELVEFWDKDMKLEIYANGKLASIVDKDGDSPIVYYVKDSELVKVQKFKFFKNQSNKWVMIR